MDHSELDLACQLGEALLKRHWRCAVAESCTGGRVAAAITEIAGSSAWFDRGFVTYSNQSKIDLLGVSEKLLVLDGAVSESVVRAMAAGALAASQADITVAISGIAGPGGGTSEKPVGLVWFAWAQRCEKTHASSFCLQGNRAAVRSQAVSIALNGMIART